MPKSRRFFLKEREAKALVDEASKKLKVDLKRIFGSDFRLELAEADFGEVYLVKGKPAFFKAGGNLYPTLLFDEVFAAMPKVVVDMGAVPHVCNGADVMAPGIVRFEGDFRKGDLVVVVDEKHGKPLMVGEALYDASEAVNVKRGVVFRNVHFVGDRVWKAIKELV
jgi:PUA domain protein